MQREQRKRKLKPVMVDMAESNLSYIGGKRFPQHSDSDKITKLCFDFDVKMSGNWFEKYRKKKGKDCLHGPVAKIGPNLHNFQ